MIIRIDRYTNENAKLVEECIVINNDNPKPYDRFLGTAAIELETPMGPQRQVFKFKIKADSIEQAFERFGECARKHVDKMEEEGKKAALDEINKIQIAQPGQVPPNPNRRLII